MSPAAGRTAATAVALALLVTAGLAAGLLGGTAAAGDNPGLLDFQPRESEAAPGETVTVDATLRSDGGYDDDGVVSINQTIAYDPEVLSVVDVERGPWLEQGDETDVVVETDVDEEAGRVTIDQERDPVAGGATGEGATATITFEVAEDAPPSDAIVQYASADAGLESDYPLQVIERAGVVSIDGGGEERAPSGDDISEDAPRVVSGDTPGEGDPTETDANGDDGGSDADGAGFGAGVALVALVASLGVARRRAARRRDQTR